MTFIQKHCFRVVRRISKVTLGTIETGLIVNWLLLCAIWTHLLSQQRTAYLSCELTKRQIMHTEWKVNCPSVIAYIRSYCSLYVYWSIPMYCTFDWKQSLNCAWSDFHAVAFNKQKWFHDVNINVNRRRYIGKVFNCILHMPSILFVCHHHLFLLASNFKIGKRVYFNTSWNHVE